MSSASESQPLDTGRASSRHRLDMVEFEQFSCRATPPVRAHERALTVVSLPDGASNGRGDVAGLGRAPPRPVRPSIRLAPGGAEPPPLELGNESIERPVDHLGHFSARDGMAEQLLGIPKLVVRALGNRHLDQVALLCGLGPRALNMPWGMLDSRRCRIRRRAEREHGGANMPWGMWRLNSG